MEGKDMVHFQVGITGVLQHGPYNLYECTVNNHDVMVNLYKPWELILEAVMSPQDHCARAPSGFSAP
jgi:hypothetical protein